MERRAHIVAAAMGATSLVAILAVGDSAPRGRALDVPGEIVIGVADGSELAPAVRESTTSDPNQTTTTTTVTTTEPGVEPSTTGDPGTTTTTSAGGPHSPAPQPDALAVDSGSTLALAAPGILANDADGLGHQLAVTAIDTRTLGGQLIIDASGAVVFRPFAGFTGTVSATYQVTDGGATATSQVSITVHPAGRQSNHLWAVGDIAECGSNEMDDAVGWMLAKTEGTIATLGDTAYSTSSAAEFAECFDPAWGPLLPRIRPAVGNNEYNQPGARPYFDYFGSAAGHPDEGWYSYDIGSWHVVVLNSNCREIGGCGPASPQGLWLAADLAAHPSACSLAYWHHPRFSSGRHGSLPATADLWEMLDRAGADIVLVGHDHLYERFAPQSPGGRKTANGIREFVVGTGGKDFYPFGKAIANSEVRDAKTAGALRLTLHEHSYDWQFFKAAGSGKLADKGTGPCR